MDKVLVGDGVVERDLEMITTWHENETLDEVIEFVEMFDFENLGGEIRFIRI